MKVWRLLDDHGAVVASVPTSALIDPAAAASGRTGFGIYEALDASGAVIYTGRTGSLASRLRGHSTQSPWWGFAVEIRWTPAHDYGESVALERVGIATDRGDWNLSGHADLPLPIRQHLPSAMAHRLAALYAAIGPSGRSADLDNYLRTARDKGWSLIALSEPLGITREGVRRRILNGTLDHDLMIPDVPAKTPPSLKAWPRLRPREIAEMLELQPLARRVRGRTPIDHPNRIASERLSELLAEARIRGVRDREVADVLGVSVGAVRFRLARHGYRNNPPSQGDYRPGSAVDALGPDCARGHALSGENLRLINGDPSRRVCRSCERIRVANYRARKAAA